MKKQIPFALGLTARAASVVAVTSIIAFSACARPTGDSAPIAERVKSSLACPAFEDEFYDAIYSVLLSDKSLPSTEEMSKAFDAMLSGARYKSLSAPDLARVHDALTATYNTVAIETPRLIGEGNPLDPKIQLEAIAAMEMGDELTPAKSTLHQKIRAQLSDVENLMSEALKTSGSKLDCAEPVATSAADARFIDGGALLGAWKKTRAPAVYGALKALATAYQSCDAGLRPALSAATPDAKGIKIVGMHSDGIGSKRIVGDLQALLSTDPYLTSYQQPATSCFAVRTSPLIYDYGGKPLASTDAVNTLNFFADSGSGTKVLGVDCSGYVYTAFAAAGLKVRQSGKLKASGVNGLKAAMWMNPSKNGLDCFDYVGFKGSTSIKPGDVLASSGHVIMIETVGNDPFGIKRFTTEAECKLENMAVEHFDFTILQSAPVKGGIGINRIEASHYLTETGSMHDAILVHAVNACLAHVRGSNIVTRADKASLVRHLGTAACSDAPVALVHEECLATCAAP
jgi:hypothetical protein